MDRFMWTLVGLVKKRPVWFLWLGVFIAGSILVWILGAAGLRPWAANPIPGDYHDEQCEKVITDGFFLQRANYWSNYAYLLAGMLIVFNEREPNGSWRRPAGFVDFVTSMGRIIGLLFISLGIGSGWFHGTFTNFGRYFDIIGIFMLMLALCFYGYVRALGAPPRHPAILICFWTTVIFGIPMGLLKNDVNIFSSTWGTLELVAIVASAIFVTAARSGKFFGALSNPWNIAALIAIGIGAAAKFLDGNGNPLCGWPLGEDSIIQGHAVWHLFSATAMYSTYRFFLAAGPSIDFSSVET